MVFTTDIEAIKVFSEYQNCHPDGLSVSVYGGSIIYILTLAACWMACWIACWMAFQHVFHWSESEPQVYDYKEKWLIHV